MNGLNLILIYFLLFTIWLEKVSGFSMGLIKGLSFTNLGIYLLFIAWSFKYAKDKFLFDKNNLNWSIITFLFVVLISVFVKILIDEIPGLSLKRELFKLKADFTPYLLFFIVFNTIRDIKTCEKVLLGLIVFFGATLSTLILQKFGFAELSSVSVHRMGRASGWGNANSYASFLVLFIPIIITHLIFAKAKLTKRIYLFIFIISIIGLLITGSRGGIISFVFSMSIYMLYIKKEVNVPFSKILSGTMILFVIGLAGLFIAPKDVRVMISERFSLFTSVVEENSEIDPNKAVGGRFKLWSSGLKLVFERPIVGHGNDTVKELMYDRFGLDAPAHNQFINYMVQYGVIGLSVYLIMHLQILRHFLDSIRKTSKKFEKCLYIAFISGLSGWMFSMLGVQLFLQTPIFWIFTAVMYRYSEFNRNLGHAKGSTTH